MLMKSAKGADARRRTVKELVRSLGGALDAATVLREFLGNTALVFTAAILFAIGCGNKSVSDGSLTTDIQSKLYSDPTTKTGNIKVAVKDGVVTLSGDVPSSDVELQAMKLANSTTGVRSVQDQITLTSGLSANQAPPPASVPPPAAASTPPQSSAPPPPQQAASNPPSAPAQERSEPEVPRRPTTVTIPAGSTVSVRMIDSIDSGKNRVGETFRASLSAPLSAGGRVVVPSGADASVVLTEAKGAGRIAGSSELAVRLASIEYHGKSYELTTDTYSEQGKARGKQSAVRTGIGAGLGAVIGAIAGGGKGAAIGSVAGGGAGAGLQLATHGQQVKIPSETQLTFRLEEPLTLSQHTR